MRAGAAEAAAAKTTVLMIEAFIVMYKVCFAVREGRSKVVDENE
jgi:hypothetical protein